MSASFAEECGCLAEEALIVIARHAEVDIVIPGHYILEEVRAYGRATLYEVVDMCFVAYADNLAEDIHEFSVQMTQYVAIVLHRYML